MRIVAVTAKDSAFFTSGFLFMIVSNFLDKSHYLLIAYLTPDISFQQDMLYCCKYKYRVTTNTFILFHWMIMKGRWVGAHRLLCLTPGQGGKKGWRLCDPDTQYSSVFCIHKSQGDAATMLSLSGVKDEGSIYAWEKHNLSSFAFKV